MTDIHMSDCDTVEMKKKDTPKEQPESVLEQVLQRNESLNLSVQNLYKENKELTMQLTKAIDELHSTKQELNTTQRELQFVKEENRKIVEKLRYFEKQELERKQEEERRRQEHERILEQQRRERERTRGYYLQTKVTTFPKFENLRGSQIFLSECTDEFLLNPNSKRDYCFFVVNHTARLESVNLDWSKFEDFKKKAQSHGFQRIVVIAMSPGNPNVTAKAPKQLTRSGDQVITLWYQDGAFNNSANEESYNLLRQMLYAN